MRVLVACEFSGTVRDAFIEKGHDAWSLDLVATEIEGPHITGDVLEHIDDGWDMMIAHPPCTYLASSGMHWCYKDPTRGDKVVEAAKFAEKLLHCSIPKVAIENPIGFLSRWIGKPDQIIQPWQYGHPESKSTCLWLKRLPMLEPTEIIEPPSYRADGKPLWTNMTPTGQNKLGPSPDRWKLRSKTYEGIARAMAEQWG